MTIAGREVDLARRGLVETLLLVVGVGGWLVHVLGRRELRKH